MGTPFMSEIKIVTWDWPPRGWAQCDGQLLPINQNQALFSLLGTTYGGNGVTTFALPDLRGRVPIHVPNNNNSFIQGQAGGEVAHTVSLAEMPAHNHMVNGVSNAADQATPVGNMLATVDNSTFGSAYAAPAALQAMAPQALLNTGGSQPHENMMPYLVLNFVIALQGVFPSRN